MNGLREFRVYLLLCTVYHLFGNMDFIKQEFSKCGYRYFVSPKPDLSSQVRNWCRQNNAQLVHINNEDENRFIYNTVLNGRAAAHPVCAASYWERAMHQYQYWINHQRHERHIATEHAHNGSEAWVRWTRNSDPWKKDCVSMVDQGWWQSVYCGPSCRLRGICRYAADYQVMSQCTEDRRLCYSLHVNAKSWHSAADTCSQYGRLASWDSSEHATLNIVRNLTRTMQCSEYKIWIERGHGKSNLHSLCPETFNKSNCYTLVWDKQKNSLSCSLEKYCNIARPFLCEIRSLKNIGKLLEHSALDQNGKLHVFEMKPKTTSTKITAGFITILVLSLLVPCLIIVGLIALFTFAIYNNHRKTGRWALRNNQETDKRSLQIDNVVYIPD